MQDKIDIVYKALLVILLAIFLVIFYQYSENGRYTHYIYNGEVVTERIIDSRNGVIFCLSSGKAYKIDYPSGQMTITPFERKEIPPTK